MQNMICLTLSGRILITSELPSPAHLTSGENINSVSDYDARSSSDEDEDPFQELNDAIGKQFQIHCLISHSP